MTCNFRHGYYFYVSFRESYYGNKLDLDVFHCKINDAVYSFLWKYPILRGYKCLITLRGFGDIFFSLIEFCRKYEIACIYYCSNKLPFMALIICRNARLYVFLQYLKNVHLASDIEHNFKYLPKYIHTAYVYINFSSS